ASPSISTVRALTPSPAARSTAAAASAAATSSFEGMQPERAHVVPYAVDSTSTQSAPAFSSSATALSPALPAPITATSAERLCMRASLAAPEQVPCPGDCRPRPLPRPIEPRRARRPSYFTVRPRGRSLLRPQHGLVGATAEKRAVQHVFRVVAPALLAIDPN